MNKLTKFSVGLATSGLIFTMFASTAFAADSSVDGNGAGSNNTIVVTNTCTSKLSQNSNTEVVAQVNASSSTGGNSITGNTGEGDNSIESGSADTTVGIAVTGGNNTSVTPSCCCNTSVAGDPIISGNGVNTTNVIVNTNTTKQKTKQSSTTSAVLGVNVHSKTGKNKVKNNTGSGDTNLVSGSTSTTVGLGVTGGGNSN